MKRIGLAALVAAVVVAWPAAASVTTPKSGWSWGDPLPQGSAIRALDFASSRGHAAGGGCGLRRSDAGGRTFQRLPFTPTDERCSSPLAATAFPTLQTGYVVTQ